MYGQPAGRKDSQGTSNVRTMQIFILEDVGLRAHSCLLTGKEKGKERGVERFPFRAVGAHC